MLFDIEYGQQDIHGNYIDQLPRGSTGLYSRYSEVTGGRDVSIFARARVRVVMSCGRIGSTFGRAGVGAIIARTRIVVAAAAASLCLLAFLLMLFGSHGSWES